MGPCVASFHVLLGQPCCDCESWIQSHWTGRNGSWKMISSLKHGLVKAFSVAKNLSQFRVQSLCYLCLSLFHTIMGLIKSSWWLDCRALTTGDVGEPAGCLLITWSNKLQFAQCHSETSVYWFSLEQELLIWSDWLEMEESEEKEEKRETAVFTIILQTKLCFNIKNISCWKQSRAGRESTLQQRQGPVSQLQLSSWRQQLRPQARSVSGEQTCSSQWGAAAESCKLCCAAWALCLPWCSDKRGRHVAGHHYLVSQNVCFCPYSSLLSTSAWNWQLVCQAPPSTDCYSHTLHWKLWLTAWILTGILQTF